MYGNAIASVDSRSGCSLASAETEMRESLPNRPAVELEHPVEQQSPRVAIKAKGKVVFLEIADILAIHAECNYASIKYRSGTYLLRESLCSIAGKLRPYGFVQIHRSVLVNASLVDEVWPMSTGEYKLRLRTGKEYVVTRKYKDNLRHLAYVWLGAERARTPESLTTAVNNSTRGASRKSVGRGVSN